MISSFDRNVEEGSGFARLREPEEEEEDEERPRRGEDRDQAYDHNLIYMNADRERNNYSNKEWITGECHKTDKQSFRYRRKKMNAQKVKGEPAWFTEEIREEIMKRRRFNRNRRNALNGEEEEKWKNLYIEQKSKVQTLIKREMLAHEEKMKGIKEDKSNGRNTWRDSKSLIYERVTYLYNLCYIDICIETFFP